MERNEEFPQSALSQLETAPAGAAPPVRVVEMAMGNAEGERARLMQGLFRPRATIEPKYFYDPRGCALYERICTLPEYYLPGAERRIFAQHREAILRELPHAPQWIDLGCGDGRKSADWVRMLKARRYVGVDIAKEALSATVRRATRDYGDTEALGIVCDFSRSLDLRAVIAEMADRPAVFFYPGSSIGNFPEPDAIALLRSVRDHLTPAGRLFLGVDLVKDRDVLETAYADPQGVTAAFNRNVLAVVNRTVDADFVADRWEHRAVFDARAARIEMRLVARESQLVRIGNRRRGFARGDSILTEYSHKYTVEGFGTLLACAGFARVRAWTDDRRWYAVFVAGV